MKKKRRCSLPDPSVLLWRRSLNGFYVEEQEGLFGMELVAHTKEVWPIETAEDMALVPEQLDDDGLPLQIVRWSVYPLEDGDLVVVQEDGESRMLSGVNAEQLQELKKQLPGMAVCLLFCWLSWLWEPGISSTCRAGLTKEALQAP